MFFVPDWTSSYLLNLAWQVVQRSDSLKALVISFVIQKLFRGNFLNDAFKAGNLFQLLVFRRQLRVFYSFDLLWLQLNEFLSSLISRETKIGLDWCCDAALVVAVNVQSQNTALDVQVPWVAYLTRYKFGHWFVALKVAMRRPLGKLSLVLQLLVCLGVDLNAKVSGGKIRISRIGRHHYF